MDSGRMLRKSVGQAVSHRLQPTQSWESDTLSVRINVDTIEWCKMWCKMCSSTPHLFKVISYYRVYRVIPSQDLLWHLHKQIYPLGVISMQHLPHSWSKHARAVCACVSSTRGDDATCLAAFTVAGTILNRHGWLIETDGPGIKVYLDYLWLF